MAFNGIVVSIAPRSYINLDEWWAMGRWIGRDRAIGQWGDGLGAIGRLKSLLYTLSSQQRGTKRSAIVQWEMNYKIASLAFSNIRI
ncbi:hypothetical protein QUA54_07910 [Microcoleus sp. MOSTC5]|uniref:hypothetical protein n=1 Tax=Microcoleus sp. MOSTC5 TaxID=3055378 RepID=UPI002FD1FEAD